MAVIFGIFVMVNQIFSSPTFEASASSLTQNATAKTFRISLTAARVEQFQFQCYLDLSLGRLVKWVMARYDTPPLQKRYGARN